MIVTNDQIFNADQHLDRLPTGGFRAGAALAWRAKAYQLGEWARERLVNRGDTYGNYYNPGSQCGNARADRPLTPARLVSHFVGQGERVGVYSYDRDGMGTWVCIDIDAHNGVDIQNWADVVAVCEELHHCGIAPLVEHSNGDCGFKVWILFDTEVHISVLRVFGLWLCRDLEREPEVFPKQSAPTEYGNYVRLPGRHHKKLNWWSEFYEVGSGVWHQGADAPDHLLTVAAHPATLIPAAAKAYVPPVRQIAATTGTDTGGDWSAYTGDLRTLDIVALSGDRVVRSSGRAHTIICPWADQHTTGQTAYVFTGDGDRRPGFYCHHQHCQGRGLRDYLACFSPDVVDSHCTEKFESVSHVDDGEVARVVGEWPEVTFGTDDTDDTDDDLAGTYDGLEMIRRSQATKTEHLFDGLLETGVITLFAGLPYSGKSVVVLQMVKALVRGEAYHGHQCRLPGTPVLYINADALRDRQFHRRLLTACNGDEAELLALAPSIQFTQTTDLPTTVTSDYVRRLIRGLKRKHATDTVLVVIDTLRPAFLSGQGPGAENDPGVMTELLAPIRHLAGETNCPVWLLHHCAKGSGSYAGSAAIAGTTEAVWTITKTTDSTATIDVEDRDFGKRRLTVTLGPTAFTPAEPAPEPDPVSEFVERFPVGKSVTRAEAKALFPEITSDTTFRRKLDDGQRAGIHPRLERLGTGTRDDPYRYLRV